MSTKNQQKTVPRYGTKTFDLSAARGAPGEMVQVRAINYIGAVSVPDECYIRLGREEGSRIDLRNLDNIMVEPFDNVWIENPAGAGEVLLTFSTFPISTGGVIREITEITGTTTSNVTDRSARELGKARMQDSGGVLIDPREQEQYATAYAAVDLNTAATTTLYAPTGDATVSGVHMAHGGSTADVRLEVTDGVSTAVLADPAAGAALHFDGDVRLAGGTDSLQIVVETAEGAALTETAAVSRGEL